MLLQSIFVAICFAIFRDEFSESVTLEKTFVGDNCQELLDKFAEGIANFTKCEVEHARPIAVCQSCITQYLKVLELHDTILKLPDESGLACKLQLVNVDRLQVVEASYSFVIDQWKKASCNKCYIVAENKVVTPALNPETIKILNLYHLTESCFINNKNNSAICEKCKSDYLSLNNFYIEQKCSGGLCMDIIDMMNTTRSKWSTELGCCNDRNKTDYIFLASVGTVIFILVTFYTTLYSSSIITDTFQPVQTHANRWFT